jgi:hypothetical protein
LRAADDFGEIVGEHRVLVGVESAMPIADLPNGGLQEFLYLRYLN